MTNLGGTILLNSGGASTEDQPMYSLKSALLNREEKNLVRRAIFLYQKENYNKHGDLTEGQKTLIHDIADKLNLR